MEANATATVKAKSQEQIIHDLFLLMANLSQVQRRELILELFLDAVNEWHPDLKLYLLEQTATSDFTVYAIATARHTFGHLAVCGDLSRIPETVLAVLRNAIRQLAVILENRLLVENTTHDLQETQAHLEHLLNVSPAVIFRCAPGDGFQPTFIGGNVFQQFGYSPGDFTGDAAFWHQQVHAEDRECYRSGLACITKLGHCSMEYRFRHQDGSYRWIIDRRTTLPDEQGAPLHIVGSLLDVTEQKQATEKANREKYALQEQILNTAHLATLGVLSASIAHEINNPNNVIMLNAPLLEDVWKEIAPILWENMPPANALDFGTLAFDEMIRQVPVLLADISNCSRRIERIVTQLKILVRKENEVVNEPMDCIAIIRDAVALLHNKILTATHTFQVDLAEDIPTVRGSAQQFEQVVINLIVNALESLPNMDHAVTVTLRSDKSRQCVLLTVADEGCGIDAATLKHILEPLFTTRPEAGGTGLGLAVTKEIVDRHQWQLRFESEVGKGTVAMVELPISEPG